MLELPLAWKGRARSHLRELLGADLERNPIVVKEPLLRLHRRSGIKLRRLRWATAEDDRAGIRHLFLGLPAAVRRRDVRHHAALAHRLPVFSPAATTTDGRLPSGL